jgi:molybdopterin converting factor small subunit
MGKKTALIILQILFAVGVLALAYWLYILISTPIKFEIAQKERESAVITRIKDIRNAERQFKAKYQHFTADFDSLINFVLTETMEGERKIIDEDDSVAMAQAKKKYGRKFKNVEKFSFSVKDSLFKHLTPEQISELRYIPYTNNKTQFILNAGMLTTESKVVIPVVECRAPYIAFLDTVAYRQEIVNLIDNMKNNFNRYPGIMFGSMERGNNEAGNWE